MKIVLGLGNPGEKYSHTRHNAGFEVLDRAAAFFHVKMKKRCFCLFRQAKLNDALLVQPLTFMNRSGDVVHRFTSKVASPGDFAVVCDNMDLAVGGLRIRMGGGACGQKGLASICEALGTPDFLRIYVGIGRPADGESVIDYVLGIENDPEKKQLYEKTLEDAARAVKKFVEGVSVEQLQQEFNRKGIL